MKHQLQSSPCVTGGADENRALHQYAPLQIKEKITNEADMASYQAPWDDNLCKASLRTTSLYQAGGNLMWLSANPHGRCPSPALSWANVRELQQSLFEPRGENKADEMWAYRFPCDYARLHD